MLQMAGRYATRLTTVLPILVLCLAGCSSSAFKPTPADIVGAWKAEPFDFSSLRLPLSPNFEVTDKALILLMSNGRLEQQPVNGITAQDDNVIIDLKGVPLDLRFYFESKDRMYFKVPVISTKIFYTRTDKTSAH